MMGKARYYFTAGLLAAAAGAWVYLLFFGMGRYEKKPSLGPDVLHQTIEAGDLEQIESLIASGYGVNTKGQDDWTPLQRAASRGRREIVEFLIAKGAKVDAKGYRLLTQYWAT